MTIFDEIKENKSLYYNHEDCAYIINDDINNLVLDEEFIHLTITSPPYNLSVNYDSIEDTMPYDMYLEWTRQWLHLVYNWTIPTGRIAINIPYTIKDIRNQGQKFFICADIYEQALQAGWLFATHIIWEKSQMHKRTAWGSFMSPSAPSLNTTQETILIFYKDRWKREDVEGKTPDIGRADFIRWADPKWVMQPETNAQKIGHPAPFPLELPKRCMQMFSFPTDIIFDPFLGSGSTMIEAYNNNRPVIGVDISSNYCEMAKQRFFNEKHILEKNNMFF